jgi:NAD(P)-dependent dehydrogenase (short-subunit alcohol dehydrogenase family)|tara:strand:+ start:486 stop:1232 length:747 start_codon:yes stop_codon:yes gene_type:complete
MAENNKVAVVTGASRGIGAATARMLGEKGYVVCVNYQVSEAAAAAVVADIKQSGSHAIAVQADVSKPADVSRLFKTVDTELGTLKALVNNAGISGPRCRFESLPIAELANVLAVNVTGLAQCTQEALMRMSTRHGGTGGAIVNVSSGAAHRGSPGGAVHYAVSKGAVNSMTIGLSQELAGEGIRVNTVSPGLTATDMPDAAVLESAGPTIPMGRVGEADEIAAAIVWLLSDQASYVAGANIRVAGGRP